MLNGNLIQNIGLYNPWYKKGSFLFKEKKYKKRKQYYALKRYLKKEFIISLIGLRRTGKTTIIKQIINSLLKKVDVKQVLFYEFDEENTGIEAILKFYFQNILKTDIYKAKCYIFLDELQFVSNWQVVLKKYYDINPDIKFVVSGSTHLYLHKNTKESLAGRIVDIRLHPFSWHEFLNFKYRTDYDFIKNIFSKNFLKTVKENADILLYKKDLISYLSFGEFPYFFHEKSAYDLDKYYKESILEKIFSKDIHLFDIENRTAFFNLFRILNKDTASEINLQNISREIGLNVRTIKRYIDILEKMFLYSYISKHAKSLRKQIKSFKKGHAASLNLLRTSLQLDFGSIERKTLGHIIETFVYNEFVKNKIENIQFYHDTRIKKEVDFVLTKGNNIVPVEVKIAENIKKSHMSNLLYFMNANKLNRGVLIYGGDEVKKIKIDKFNIECVPYFMI